MGESKPFLANAKSTSNYGGSYEDRVTAWLYAKMLLEGSIPGISGTIKSIQSQVSHLETKKWDDLLIKTAHDSKIFTLFVQVTTSLEVTKSSIKLTEILPALKNISANPAQEPDYFVIITSKLSGTNGPYLSDLVESTRAHASHSSWLAAIMVDPELKATAAIIASILDLTLENESLWILLKKLRIIITDQLTFGSVHIDDQLQLLRSHIIGGSPVIINFFSSLTSIASESSRYRTLRTRETLLQDPRITEVFLERTPHEVIANVAVPDWIDDKRAHFEKLKTTAIEHSMYECYEPLKDFIGKIESALPEHQIHVEDQRDLSNLYEESLSLLGKMILNLGFSQEFRAFTEKCSGRSKNHLGLAVICGRLQHYLKDKESLLLLQSLTPDPDAKIFMDALYNALEGDYSSSLDLLSRVDHTVIPDCLSVSANFRALLPITPTSLQRLLEDSVNYSKSMPDRIMPKLFLAAQLVIAIEPSISPAYSQNTDFKISEIGKLLNESYEILSEVLVGQYGSLEKSLALSIMRYYARLFNSPGINCSMPIDTPPSFLFQSSVDNVIQYSITAYSLGQKETVIHLLNDCIDRTQDPDEVIRIQSLLSALNTDASHNQPNTPDSTHEGAWVQFKRALSKINLKSLSGDPEQLLDIANSYPNTALACECLVTSWVLGEDIDLADIQARIETEYSSAIIIQADIFDIMTNYIDSHVQHGTDPASQLNRDPLSVRLSEAVSFIAAISKLILNTISSKTVIHYLSLLGSRIDNQQLITLSLDFAIAYKFKDLETLALSCSANVKGDYETAARLLCDFESQSRLSAYLLEMRDRAFYLSGQYLQLTEQAGLLLVNPTRHPNTAKYTAMAYAALGDRSSALQIARKNLANFPDDQTALRDYIMLAVNFNQMELVHEELNRYIQMFPDDPSLRIVKVEEGDSLPNMFSNNLTDLWIKYENCSLPITSFPKPVIEKWISAHSNQFGIQSHRYGNVVAKLERLNPGMSLLLDGTAILSVIELNLLSKLGQIRTFTSKSTLVSLQTELNGLKFLSNESEVIRHEYLQEFLNRDKAIIHSNLPNELRATHPNGLSFQESDHLMAEHLGIPRLQTELEESSCCYTLYELINTLHTLNQCNMVEKESWIEELRDRNFPGHMSELKTIFPYRGAVSLTYADLMSICTLSFHKKLFDSLEEIHLLPSIEFELAILANPHLHNRKVQSKAKHYLKAIESMVQSGQLTVLDVDRIIDWGEPDYIAQQCECAKNFDAFWTDDPVIRRIVGTLTMGHTTSTIEVLQLLSDSHFISQSDVVEYYVILAQLGYRDILQINLLVDLASLPSGITGSPFLRYVYFVGKRIRLLQSHFSEGHNQLLVYTSQQIEAFLKAALPEHISVFLRAFVEGGGFLASHHFWRTQYPIIVEGLNSEQAFALETYLVSNGLVEISDISSTLNKVDPVLIARLISPSEAVVKDYLEKHDTM